MSFALVRRCESCADDADCLTLLGVYHHQQSFLGRVPDRDQALLSGRRIRIGKRGRQGIVEGAHGLIECDLVLSPVAFCSDTPSRQ